MRDNTTRIRDGGIYPKGRPRHLMTSHTPNHTFFANHTHVLTVVIIIIIDKAVGSKREEIL